MCAALAVLLLTVALAECGVVFGERGREVRAKREKEREEGVWGISQRTALQGWQRVTWR